MFRGLSTWKSTVAVATPDLFLFFYICDSLIVALTDLENIDSDSLMNDFEALYGTF